MIRLIYNDKEINFSENILKISGFINTLYEDNNYNPVIEITSVNTIVNITDEILDYFNLWFNELDKLEIVKYERENVIFKPTIFEECNTKTLIDIFNFGFYFQIRMLCETISYILSKNDIIEHDDKYYIGNYRIQISLAMMMLKYMSKEQFKKQSSNVQNLIKWKKICVIDFSNIKDYYILPHDKTEIYDNEFKRRNFKKVIIPDSVTSIGKSAFWGCESLEEIVIPDGVTDIESHTFHGCTSLTKVFIPNSVTRISGYTFYKCENLEEIFIPNSITRINIGTFCNCTSLTKVVIPSSVTSIGVLAFRGTSLKEVIIPNGVTSIYDDAFYCCKSLTKVVIPNSVTNIGEDAFRWCESLKEVTLPKHLDYPFNRGVKVIRV